MAIPLLLMQSMTAEPLLSDPEPRVVLFATITAGPAHAFAVDIDDHATPLREEECFRFALHYYARVLYELAQAGQSVRELREWTSRIAATDLDRDADLFAVTGACGSLARTLGTTHATADVVMQLAGVRDREVVGDLDALQGPTLARSVVAVFQSIIPRLSDAVRAAVPAAIANMNVSYELTHRHADPESQREVPTTAYLAASFV